MPGIRPMGPDISSENPLALSSWEYVIKNSLAMSTVFVTDLSGPDVMQKASLPVRAAGAVPEGAPRSGEAEADLTGRPCQRVTRTQAASRCRFKSAMKASRGIRQLRHFIERSFSIRSMRLISSSRMSSNGLPFGRTLRTMPFRFLDRLRTLVDVARSQLLEIPLH